MNSDFLLYNATDSVCTLDIDEHIWPDVHTGGFDAAYNMTVDVLPSLMFMQTIGIKVDKEALANTSTDIAKAITIRQEELNRLCGRELNVNSSPDCQKYFYVELGIPPYYNEGRVTTDDTALQRLCRGTAKRPGLRQAKLVQEIRGYQKLNSTYLSMEFDEDGRFRSSYNPRGTKFGRFSSSKTIFGTGGNAQNLDPAFKKFLCADEGKLLVEFDKRQAEWVIVAYLCGDANMLKVIQEGKDTHVHTASLIFNADPELVELDDKLIGYNNDPELIMELRSKDPRLEQYIHSFPRTMSARQCGKKSNHGLNYDEGHGRFSMINEIELPESKRIVEGYHSIYPGIRQWYEYIKRLLQRDRSLTNCFSRKVRFMDAWGPDLFKSAYSMLPSSTNVDALNQGMVKTYNDDAICGSTGHNIDLLAQVHDSLLFQIPIPVLASPEFAKLQEIMYNYLSPSIEYNGRSFKIATDMKVGRNWGGYHKELNPLGMQEVKSLDQLPAILSGLNVT